MEWLLNCCLNILITFIGILLLLCVWYYRKYNYWERRNIPTLPKKFLIGNFDNPFGPTNPPGVLYKKFYDEFDAKNHICGGIYMLTKPVLIPVDVDLIKNILTKDFPYFDSRGGYVVEKEIISNNLFNFDQAKWKSMRTKLTPHFTAGKIKLWFDLLLEKATPLHSIMDDLIKMNEPVNIKKICVCFTTDIIGSFAFGIDLNSFEDNDSEFIRTIDRVVHVRPWEFFKAFCAINFPWLCAKLGVCIVNMQARDFFVKFVTDIVEYREKNNIRRNDFMQVLIDLKNQENDDKSSEFYKNFGGPFDIKTIIAQSFLFFLGGYETSSSTMTFAMFELAMHQDIQDKVRHEVRSVLRKYDGKFTYESVNDMKYLTQLVEETLRMYPIIPSIPRKCVKTYKVPNSNIIIEKDTLVMLSPLGVQRNANYYPDPMKFDPDRFSDDNKKDRNPYTYLPFGEGPRACIGQRFGIIETKIGLAHLLMNYKYTLNEKTKIPLEYGSGMALVTKDDIWLNAIKVEFS